MLLLWCLAAVAPKQSSVQAGRRCWFEDFRTLELLRCACAFCQLHHIGASQPLVTQIQQDREVVTAGSRGMSKDM